MYRRRWNHFDAMTWSFSDVYMTCVVAVLKSSDACRAKLSNLVKSAEKKVQELQSLVSANPTSNGATQTKVSHSQ